MLKKIQAKVTVDKSVECRIPDDADLDFPTKPFSVSMKFEDEGFLVFRFLEGLFDLGPRLGCDILLFDLYSKLGL